MSLRTGAKKLSKNSEGFSRFTYHVWIGLKLRRCDLDLTEMFRVFVRNIPIQLGVREHQEFLVDELSRLRLTKCFANDPTNDRFEDEALEIEFISFEDDRYVAIESRYNSKHTIIPYKLQVLECNQSSDHDILSDKIYINGRDHVSAYLLTDAWCQKHPGSLLSMAVSVVREESSYAPAFHLRHPGITISQNKTKILGSRLLLATLFNSSVHSS